ncbi:VirB3 family type IV secretion system protein [Vibrio cholerae]
MEEPETQEYASYNVLARKPLIMGVPIITLVVFLLLMLLTGLGGMLMFGFAKALIMPILLFVTLLFIRLRCMTDSRAMESMWWDTKAAISRLICQSEVTSFTSTDDSHTRRRARINEWYKNYSNIKKTTQIRLSNQQNDDSA